ncbi:MAG: DUF885 domain-containing protein [Gammaproteobacteria bacterium]
MRNRIRILASLAILTAVTGAAEAGEFSEQQWRAAIVAERDINRLAASYVEYLAHADQVYASQLGMHGTPDDPRYFDRRLTDVSVEAWSANYDAHLFLREVLAAFDPDSLSDEDRIDHHILSYRVERRILGLTRLQNMLDPLAYVTNLGAAFNVLVLRDYAPVEQRLQSFGERCAATREYLEQSRRALMPPHVQPSAIKKQVAAARLANMYGPKSLFERTLPGLLAGARLKPAAADQVRARCRDAAAAIAAFRAWLEAEILPRPDGPWRIGRELYEQQYLYQMDYPLGPEELLAEATRQLEVIYAEVIAIARRIHDGYLGDAIASGELHRAAELDDREVAGDVFGRIAEDHSSVDSLIEDSYAMADAIVGFVEENDLLDLPPTSKLRIEEIPPHLSGYAVAQIQTAPPFEPEVESVWFWDLELLAEADDFLKEYNRPALAAVYIHEGVPGHFVQLEYSNASERIAPKVFWNGPMVEGWASYIETQLVDQGFTVYPNEPYGHELQKLASLKLDLRMITNTIIDVRLQTTDWPEEAALALMTERGFQEQAEARGKLNRAKLGAVQLSTYYAGYRAIMEILGEYRALKGDDFTWKDFNERLIGAGSPPFFALRRYMLDR